MRSAVRHTPAAQLPTPTAVATVVALKDHAIVLCRDRETVDAPAGVSAET
jgi:hypothetical protein